LLPNSVINSTPEGTRFASALLRKNTVAMMTAAKATMTSAAVRPTRRPISFARRTRR
jgi:hypothetical protein